MIREGSEGKMEVELEFEGIIKFSFVERRKGLEMHEMGQGKGQVAGAWGVRQMGEQRA